MRCYITTHFIVTIFFLQICRAKLKDGISGFDTVHNMPYYVNEFVWVSYENERSLSLKVLQCSTTFSNICLRLVSVSVVCFFFFFYGASCSSVVRAFAHGAMGCRIDPSWGGPIELFLVPASTPRLV